MDASSRNNTGKRGVTGSAYASACSQELAEVGTTSCHDFGSNDPWKQETSPLRSNSFKDPQFRCAGAPFVPPESRMSSGGVSPGIVTLNAAMSACELTGQWQRAVDVLSRPPGCLGRIGPSWSIQ